MRRQLHAATSVSDAKRMLQILALFALLAFSINVLADNDEDKRLREQMVEAQEQLDEAARRVAELSRQMSGGEVARVVKRMSVGHRKAMLGVRIDDAKAGDGVLIESVTKEGPAERAGVEAGDLVQSINGTDLTSGSRSDAIEGLLKTLKGLEPNDVASLGIRRDGRNFDIDVTTESVAKALPRFGAFTDAEGNLRQVSEILENLAIDLPDMHADIQIDGDFSKFELDEGQVEELRQLPKRLEEAMGKLSSSGPVIAMLGGFTGLGHKFHFAPVTPSLGDYFGVKRGVLLTAVPANNTQGLEEGDVLLTINAKPVDSRHDVHAEFARAEEGDTLAVELVRQRQSLIVDVVKPASSWGRAWKCLSGDNTNKERKSCISKDGSSFSFRFSTDDATDNE